MKSIIIAAGLSTRLRPLTDDLPKCMLTIDDKPILKIAIDQLRSNGVKDISVVKGYKKEKINFEQITYFENNNYTNNNILHSLMHAREKLEEALRSNENVIVSYSDITYHDDVLTSLIDSNKDIVAVVDTEWKSNYKERTDHTPAEAENVVMNKDKVMLKIGKNVLTSDVQKDNQGEFIGLWKFSPKGVKIFLDHFDKLNKKLNKTEPFQNAKEWQKSYITDIFQDLIDNGTQIHCVNIKNNWVEFDTVQDYHKVSGG